MRILRGALPLLALILGACSDEPTRPSGPVTIRFATLTFPKFTASGPGRDTGFATVIFDDSITLRSPTDSLTNVPRGLHLFRAKFDYEYLEQAVLRIVDPPGTVEIVPILWAPSCRVYRNDAQFCRGQNYMDARAHRLFCPAGDFGEFCAKQVDALGFGGSWPFDTAASADNEYIGHAKLLIAARTAAGAPAAMSFLDAGDYLPRVRHHVDRTDSSYWQSTVWTDGRHVPIFPDSVPALAFADRKDVTFGLQVKQTYLLPREERNAILVRFDVTNISDSADYRRVHPEMPAGGRTLSNIYLAPLVDVDVGGLREINGNRVDDRIDDNGTLFPADSMVVGWDQEFAAPAMGGGYASRPGVVGVRLIEGPPGASALVLDGALSLGWDTPADEDRTYRILAAGRDGAATECSSPAAAMPAYVCMSTGSVEAEHDVRIGWSVGPIAQLAPGETVTLTIAILVAPPQPGTFTSGTSVAPQQNALDDTSRPIYLIAAPLRAAASGVKTLRVTNTNF